MTMGEQVTHDVRADIIECIQRRLPYARSVQQWDGVRLADLGLDSMAAIDLVLDIEQALDVVFPDQVLVAETFATTDSLCRVVMQLRGGVP